MKIYTKKGDKGTTSLFGGGIYRKDHIRIEAYGTLDELNSCIGHLRDLISIKTTTLSSVQHQLFNLGANLATKPGNKPPFPFIEESIINDLESEIGRMDERLEVLKNFILPVGHTQVSWCHICRTVCRRAERRLVTLANEEKIDETAIIYLNRLSDYLFVLARTIADSLGVKEVAWDSTKGR
jgi:cob(I)alamin adenosyltransferase